MESNILVVDDALTSVRAVQAMLEGDSVPEEDILTAHTAAEAMRLFEEHRPGTVLLDIDLPDMGGHELAKDLREVHPESRIVAVTGLSPRDHRVAGLVEEGDVDLVEKPLEHRDLADLGILPDASA